MKIMIKNRTKTMTKMVETQDGGDEDEDGEDEDEDGGDQRWWRQG